MEVKLNISYSLYIRLIELMSKEGYESFNVYLETILQRIITQKDLQSYISDILSRVELLERGSIFNVLDLISETDIEFSLQTLNEIENLIESYASKANCNYNLELMYIDGDTLITTYMKS